MLAGAAQEEGGGEGSQGEVVVGEETLGCGNGEGILGRGLGRKNDGAKEEDWELEEGVR